MSSPISILFGRENPHHNYFVPINNFSPSLNRLVINFIPCHLPFPRTTIANLQRNSSPFLASSSVYQIVPCSLSILLHTQSVHTNALSGCSATLVSIFCLPSLSFSYNFLFLLCFYAANFATNIKTLQISELREFCRDYQIVAHFDNIFCAKLKTLQC